MRLRQLQVLIQLIPDERLDVLNTPSCPNSSLSWTKHGLNSDENELLHKRLQSFHQGDVRAKGQRSLNCFGADFFRTGITLKTFQRQNVYGSLEDVPKNAAELISTKCLPSRPEILFTLIPFNNLFTISSLISMFLSGNKDFFLTLTGLLIKHAFQT